MPVFFRKKHEKIKFKINITQNRLMLFFIIILLLGMVFGAFISVWMNNSNMMFINDVLINFIEKRGEQKINNTFISAITPNIISWGIVFLCGFCAVSAPLIILIPFIRAMGYGVIASALIINYSFAGVKYILSHLLVNYLVSAIVLIFCCHDSIRMSKYIWQTVYSKKIIKNNDSKAAIYCGKMIIYVIIIIAGALYECYTYWG